MYRNSIFKIPGYHRNFHYSAQIMNLAILSHNSISIPSSSRHQFHSSSPLTNSPLFPPTTKSPSIQRLLFFPKKSKTLTITNNQTNNNNNNQSNSNSNSNSSTKLLRQLLQSPGIHQGPACFDALSAKLVENAGFQFCFMSGFSVSAARLGLPDVGLISYGEMLDQGRLITEAVSIPVIGDGDNGYGNAMNVKRTVKGFINAGFAGIILEDQVSPKACGHTQGRRVVSREEAVMRIKAAVDARRESGSDIVIVARTDSRQAISLEESLWRSRAFGDAGADVLFIDALASKDEMKAFCEVFPLLPKMANMLEGGGKTPILNPIELQEIGFKIVSYPLSLIGVSIRAMQDALAAIKGGRLPPPANLPSFDEIKDTLGFNAYYGEEKQYDTSISQRDLQRGYSVSSSDIYSVQRMEPGETEERDLNQHDPVIEVITPEVYYPTSSSKGSQKRSISRILRVKITGRDGSVKLEIKIPAGFLEGITDVVPALVGVNLRGLLDEAGEASGGKTLIDFYDNMGDRIQVFLE